MVLATVVEDCYEVDFRSEVSDARGGGARTSADLLPSTGHAPSSDCASSPSRLDGSRWDMAGEWCVAQVEGVLEFVLLGVRKNVM